MPDLPDNDNPPVHDEEPTDPPVGSAEYWQLPTAEQHRIAMASIGIGSNAPAWTSSQAPYSAADNCPLDDWTD